MTPIRSANPWRSTSPDGTIAGILFGLSGLIYFATGATFPVPDALPHVALAASVVAEGDAGFTPSEAPALLHWQLRNDSGAVDVNISTLDDEIGDLFRSGQLVISGQGAELRPARTEGMFANTFGLGAGLTAIPVAGLVTMFIGPITGQTDILYLVCRYTAALCVAGSVAFVFLAARQFADLLGSLIIAGLYGWGTSVWTMSSQSLWQASPNELYLALGIFAFLRSRDSWSWSALTGAALGMATLSRPTSGVFVVCISVYLLARSRRELMFFLAGGVPTALALAEFNLGQFGSLFAFGQLMLDDIAVATTGNEEIWTTPIMTGAFAHLFGPSRGLLIFSPFLIFSLVGILVVWRDSRYGPLRPWTIGIVIIFLVECKHFDYWGGWCFGDRHILDLTVILSVLIAPVIGSLLRSPITGLLLLVLGSWSIGVQALGACCYDMYGWNCRMGALVRKPDPEDPGNFATFDMESLRPILADNLYIYYTGINIDEPQHRHRLWSLQDNQIGYYATHISESRVLRHVLEQWALQDRSGRLAATKRSVGEGFLQLRDFEQAAMMLEHTLRVWPHDERAQTAYAVALVGLGRIDDARDLLTSALENRPESFQLLNSLGFVEAFAGNHQQAIEYWKQSVVVNPVFWFGPFQSERERWTTAFQSEDGEFLRRIQPMFDEIEPLAVKYRRDLAADASRELPVPTPFEQLRND